MLLKKLLGEDPMVYRGGGKGASAALPTYATHITDPQAYDIELGDDGSETVLNDVTTKSFTTKDGVKWDGDVTELGDIAGVAVDGLNTGAPEQKYKDTNAAKRGIQL